MRNKIFAIVLMCCAVGFLYSGYGLVTAWNTYTSAALCYETIQDQKKLEDLVSIEAKTGDVQPEDNLTHTMKQINADYIGWITIGDTKIDYPIVHSNPKKNYLDHDFYGNRSVYGTLCIRHGQKLFENRNTVIYGHNMKDGGMFATLKRYLEKSWFDEHPDVQIRYDGQAVNCKVFSVQIISENNDYPYADRFNDVEYSTFLNEMVQLSRIVPGELPDPEYPIITLSTCYGQKRLIVMAQSKEERENGIKTITDR